MKTSHSIPGLLLILPGALLHVPSFPALKEEAGRKSSAFYPPELIEKARTNIKKYPRAAQMRNLR